MHGRLDSIGLSDLSNRSNNLIAGPSSAEPHAEGVGRAGAHRTHALQQSQWWWSMRQGPQVLAAHSGEPNCCMQSLL